MQLQLAAEEEDGVKQDTAASVTDEIDIDIVMGRTDDGMMNAT